MASIVAVKQIRDFGWSPASLASGLKSAIAVGTKTGRSARLALGDDVPFKVVGTHTSLSGGEMFVANSSAHDLWFLR